MHIGMNNIRKEKGDITIDPTDIKGYKGYSMTNVMAINFKI